MTGVGTAAKVAIAVVVVAVVVVVVTMTPVVSTVLEYANPEALERLFAPVKESPLLPLYTWAAFVIAGAVFLSVWIVIFQTCLMFSPAAAFPMALSGALLSSVIFYGVGRAAGKDVVARFAPKRVVDAVEGAGLDAIIAVRLLPVLPFTFVNLCCGAFNVRFRTFVMGTVIGMSPGILAMTFLGERVLAVIRHPTPEALAMLLGVVVVVVGVAAVIRRRAARALAKAHHLPPPPDT